MLNRLGRKDEAANPVEGLEGVDKVLLLANETMTEDALVRELEDVHAETGARIHVTVPSNPVDTGTGRGRGRRVRLGGHSTCGAGAPGHDARGAARPGASRRPERSATTGRWWRCGQSVAEFQPDLVIISTHAREHSSWLRKDIVSAAREELSVPVRHVIPSEADSIA